LRQIKCDEVLKHQFPKHILKVPSWTGRRIERYSDSKVIVPVRMMRIHEKLDGTKMKAMAERIEKRVESWIDIFGDVKRIGDERLWVGRRVRSRISELFKSGGVFRLLGRKCGAQVVVHKESVKAMRTFEISQNSADTQRQSKQFGGAHK
jgi:hypothetical protein